MSNDYKRLYRSRSDRMLSGLCGGLGEFLGTDPTVIRLVFALLTLFFFPIPIVVYLVMVLIVPEVPVTNPSSPVEVIES